MIRGTLFAISYHYVPELIEHRERYERFWAIVSGIAILGWIVAFVVYRFAVKPLKSNSGSTKVKAVGWTVISMFFILGFVIGWSLWVSGWFWTWGDYGVGLRWVAELTACTLGAAGWGAVGGETSILIFRWSFPAVYGKNSAALQASPLTEV